MTNLPIVLVLSSGVTKAEDIITNIRKISIEEDKEELDAVPKITGYKYNLITKYYTTDLLLCPLNVPLVECPLNLLNYVEGVLIYFDAENREFIKEIPKYADFLDSNQIEFGILLCNELCDDATNGVTYKEAKQCSTLLDVIELGRQRDDDEEEEDDLHDPIGYDELTQAMRSFIWSNVNVNGASRVLTSYVNLGADDIDLSELESELNAAREAAELASPDDMPDLEDEAKIEAELMGFEKLLNDVMQFKSNTSSWSRDETLSYAMGFAEMFGKIIGEEGGGSTGDGGGGVNVSVGADEESEGEK